ncbi:MAG: insulinase family protein [Bacteroidaceae bacterium]|nr:insulinase family protein [Bacteroidaceae bacterium]
MKNLIRIRLFSIVCCLLTVVCCLYSCKGRNYESVNGDPMQTRIYTLDNGLKVYLSVNKEEPRIQTYIAVRTGSKNDPAETTGLAHYLEHLMFKGTKQFGTTDPEAEAPLLDEIEQRYEEYRTITDEATRKQKYHEIDSVSQLAAKYFIPNEYDKLMAAIGSQGSNAFTSNDVTCYVEDIPSNEIENWAKVQADRFQNMVIRGFHTELEAVYEEYNIGLSSDGNKQYEALLAKLFPTHPYGTQTTIGTQQHLKNPSITNIKNYFAKWYVPNNVAICMAGDFDPDKTLAILKKYFGEWKPGDDVSQPSFPELEPLTAPVDTTVIGQEAENIWLGWRSEKASSLQNDTLELVDVILSNGRAGLLDLDLNQEMKVMEAGSFVEPLLDHGFFLLAGTPKEGQSLDEVKDLLLAEIEKLKAGDFDDDLLLAALNNKKLDELRSLDHNQARTSKMLDAFINGIDWQQQVGQMDRLAKITKEEVVAFANRFFTEGYVTVYKRQGEDTTQKKIDKPAITPIPTNRDLVSQFVKDIQEAKVDPIEPLFLDFEKDLSFFKTQKGLPVIYKQNTENGLFELQFRYEFGQEDDNRYDVAASYIDYLGTDKLSAAQVKQQFYKMACNYAISVNADAITIGLSGLAEYMPDALALLEDLLHNAKVDQNAYEQMVGLILKNRQDQKAEQRSCFTMLGQYGMYGPHNALRDNMTAQQLQETNPQELLDLLKNISQYEHQVLYYGPILKEKLDGCVSDLHPTVSDLKPVPEGEPYKLQLATTPEVLIAPYDAKNIYMRMYYNEGKETNIEEHAVIEVFNEYFGGGMNGVVFQELREARGLAYNAMAYYLTPAKKGQPEYFLTHIITQNDKMMDCVNQFREIIDKMPENEGAFQIAKDALTKQIASRRTTKFGVIQAYISAKRQGFDFDIDKKIYEDLQGLGLKDIADFEKKFMAQKTGRYFILGNEKELDMAALGQIGPIRRVSLEEVFGY